jgi:hypothetical protein
MLLHLPIAILASFSPVAISDAVPKFDIVRECRFEGGSTVEFDHCSDDESAALRQLETEWAQFAGVDRRQCIAMATIGGFASYVELLTCLEMARDLARADDSPRGPAKPQLMQPGRPGSTVGVGHGPTTLSGNAVGGAALP